MLDCKKPSTRQDKRVAMVAMIAMAVTMAIIAMLALKVVMATLAIKPILAIPS